MGKRPKNKSKKRETTKQIEKHDYDDKDLATGKSEESKTGDNDGSEKLTLAALDATISDEEDDALDQKSEWNAEAKALRQAIADGKFNGIGLSHKDDAQTKDNATKDTKEKRRKFEDRARDDDGKQVVLEDDSSEEEEDPNDQADGKRPSSSATTSLEGNIKGLRSVTAHLLADKALLPWAETFDIIPSTPLPFGRKSEDGSVIDVHDDLKREVAFYNMALEAVHDGRKKCEDSNIPFSRPEDFFAEMVKTDDHMAMVKDRLIFEGKKMEAFEQRKSNRELKLRAKESHAHRIVEKAKAKKKHMQDVDDWAKNAASNRAGGGRVRDDDDDAYLNKMGVGPNKKRQGMNSKYGFGGKSSRFKQNEKSSLNDMSGYNPRGGNGGMGKSSGGGDKRKGKRARDASKARR